MSSRGTLASVGFICLVAMVISSAGLAAETTLIRESAQQRSALRDQAPSQSSATQPAESDQPKAGAVQVALKRLYAIPRLGHVPERAIVDGPGSTRDERVYTGDDSQLGLAHDRAIRQSVSSAPVGEASTENNLGSQHADSMRDTVARRPGSDDDPRPAPEDLPPGISAPIYFGPDDYVYYHRSRRLPNDEREWNNYVYHNGRPSRYGYGMHDEYGGGGVEGDIYRFGFNRGYNTGRFDQLTTGRQQRLLDHAQSHLERGLVYFRKGQYLYAADAFKLAAETNQGDPASRLYVAHALFARGRYRDAIPYLRRAFELQPKIVFLTFDIRDDYEDRREFDQQLEQLERAVQRFPGSQERLILLGYARYYGGQRDDAYEPLIRAHQQDPEDMLIKRLLDNCQPPDVVLEEMAVKKQAGG